MLLVQILILVVAFYGIGWCAGIVVDGLRMLAQRLGISLFFLGIILGFFTSLPELAIGVNALVHNVDDLAWGNLMGGVVLLFSLILGLNLVLNRRIADDGRLRSIMPLALYCLVPIILGFDGVISSVDGFILILLYVGVVYGLSRQHQHDALLHMTIGQPKTTARILMKIMAALAGVVLLSQAIVTLTLGLLQILHVSTLLVGLIIFSVGTNLPELVVTITAWRRRVHDLSLSNLFGSAIANVCILGLFTLVRPFPVSIDIGYYSLGVFLAILLCAVILFYKTGKSLARSEGMVLLLCYGLFVTIQIALVTIESVKLVQLP